MANRGSFRQGRGSSRRTTVNVSLDGGAGSALTTGLKTWWEIPFPCVIEKAKIEADQSGSVVLDIYRLTEAERIQGVAAAAAYSICTASKPTLSTAQRMTDTTLNGWNVQLEAEDWLYLNVDSVTSISKLTLSLTLRRLLA